MPIVETISGTEPARVVVAQDGPVAHVWMRRNIEKDVKDPDDGEGESYEFWCAKELAFTVAGSPTAAGIEADFDAVWAEHERDGMTEAERITELEAQNADMQAALLELGDMVGGE